MSNEIKIKHLSPYLPFSLTGTLKAFKDQPKFN